MRKILLGALIALVLFFIFQYVRDEKNEQQQLHESTALIEKQLKNVGKLVVTEGSYAQVYNYNDTKSLLAGLVESKKKALVIINAEASISYDLSKIKTQIIPEVKTVVITEIPEPELKINPNIEYYDVTQNYLNPFDANDYNLIKTRIEQSLREKIEASDLKTNAQNRLISELQKIYILTNSLDWTLQYNDTQITPETDYKTIDFKN